MIGFSMLSNSSWSTWCRCRFSGAQLRRTLNFGGGETAEVVGGQSEDVLVRYEDRAVFHITGQHAFDRRRYVHDGRRRNVAHLLG